MRENTWNDKTTHIEDVTSSFQEVPKTQHQQEEKQV
jgi:hypothetical protein